MSTRPRPLAGAAESSRPPQIPGPGELDVEALVFDTLQVAILIAVIFAAVAQVVLAGRGLGSSRAYASTGGSPGRVELKSP